MRLALFEPDIPQNLGAFIRLSACLGIPLDLIEPCGFPVDDKRIPQARLPRRGAADHARGPLDLLLPDVPEVTHPALTSERIGYGRSAFESE